MILNRCLSSTCHRYVLHTGICHYCGNDSHAYDFVGKEQVIPARALTAYNAARSMIDNREFQEALKLLDIVKQWCPNESGIYYHRLLARSESTFEGDLLLHGFRAGMDGKDAQGDIDFMLAQKYASSDEERTFYEMLAQANNEICTELTQRERTAFEAELTEMQEQIRSRAPEISKMQEELQKLQQALMKLILARTDAENELLYAVNAQKASEVMLSIKHFNDMRFELKEENEDLIKKFTSGTMHAYYMRMAAAADMNQDAKYAAEVIPKEHPWCAVIAEMKAKEAELEKQIADKQEQIRRNDSDLVEMQERYQTLQESYAKTMQALHACRFRDALRHEDEKSLMMLVYEKSGIQLQYLKHGYHR